MAVLTVPSLLAPHGFTFGEAGACIEDEIAALGRGFGVREVHHLRQVHGNRVRILPDSGEEPADGAVLLSSGEAVAVKTADCVPILFHAPASGLVAGAHAGWRGTADGVAARTASALARESGEPAASIVAAIGPAIQPCCFEVGPEVPEAFRKNGWRVPEAGRNPRSGRPHLDLIRANRDQLLEAGLEEQNIHETGLCTRCGAGFHSYRRDGPGAGRNWSLIVHPGPATN